MQFSRKNKKCNAKMFTISYKLKHTQRVVREAATICNITTKKKHSLEKKTKKSSWYIRETPTFVLWVFVKIK